jgi:hypothetical protein
MKIRILSFMTISALLIAALLGGCGGGSGGSGGSSFSGGSGYVTTPTTGTSSGQGTVLGTKGYVYVASGSGKAGNKASTQEIVVLASNSSVPQGFAAAVGYVVRSSSNPTLFTRTDYNGYYDLSTSGSSESSGDQIVIEDPYSQAEPVCFPVIGEPLPAAQLTGITIVPPFSDDTSSGPWSIVSGSYEAFYLVGQSNGVWHPVSDTVTWSVSDSNLGSFYGGSGLFLASSSLTASASGTVTAQCSGSSYSLPIKVISQSDLGSISGTVMNENGLAAPGLLVEVSVTTSNTSSQSPHFSYGIAITDQNGLYQVSKLPYGSYSVKVKSFFGSTLAESTVQVAGAVQKDFTVSSAAAAMQSVVKTDSYLYKPGGTIQAQVSMINMSSGSIETAYSSITFKLIYYSFTDYTTQVIATGTAGSGVIKAGGYGTTAIPSQPVSISIPESAQTSGFYSLEAVISSTPGFSVDAAFIMVSSTDNPTPWPTPTSSPEPWPTASPYPYPTDYPFPTPTYTPFPTPTPLPSLTPLPTYSPMPYPTPTSSPSSGNDRYILADIKYRLQDAYHEIYSAANQAYYGENVTSQVNEGSNIQYRIKYVKNTLMPSLQSVNYWRWQSELESVLNDLNRYAYYGGTYSDLYSAARGTDYVVDEVASAQNSVSGLALKKKSSAKKKTH